MSHLSGIPILLLGYNRPELLKRRFYEIVIQKPSSLYISIDGGPHSENQAMDELVREIETMARSNENIFIQRHDINLGLARHVTSAIDFVLAKHSKIIVVEDDIVLSQNFYSNMCNGFKTLENTKDTFVISAFSPRVATSRAKNHWRKSIYFSPWGWGTSDYFWKEYKLELELEDFEKSLMNSSTWNSLTKYQKSTWIHKFEKIRQNPFDTWDIQFQYLVFKKGTPCLLPKYRIIDNEGYSDPRSTHTKEAKPRWFKNGVIETELLPDGRKPKLETWNNFIDAQTLAGDSRLVGNWKKLKRFRFFKYVIKFIT